MTLKKSDFDDDDDMQFDRINEHDSDKDSDVIHIGETKL